jgi:hypothetical protein
MSIQIIANALKQIFYFLQEEYGFKPVSIDIDKEFCVIKMQNNSTGIALHYARRESNIFVYLYRLINGKMVEDITPVSSDRPLNSIELQYIIQLREGENYIAKVQKQSSRSVVDLVQESADDLKKYAADVLTGNFEVFNEVDSVAKKRRLEWQNS